ncbi:MAG: CTP synthase, partial [Phycisphaerae bacterium]
EVGGTVGDLENSNYLEACRQLAYEEGEGSVVFVALTYVLEPGALGEQKSKAAQLGIKRLMELGIMPHLLACRASNPVKDKVREKISMYTNVPMRRVFSMHDVSSIYLIPESMREAGIDREVLTMLDLHDRVNQRVEDANRNKWRNYVEQILKPKKQHVTIAVTGKYTALRDAYASIIKSVEHCSATLNVDVQMKWLDTTDVTAANVATELAGVDGIIVPGGFGVRGTEGKIECIRHAREQHVPYLGLCLGFQMAVIEYARNVCGIKDADSSEFDPRCVNPVIDILPEQKKIEGLGGNMRLGGKDVEIKAGTLAAKLFDNARKIRLRFRHRYEVDPKYIAQLEASGMVFSGKHPTQPIMQVLELSQSQHPYFIGTQAHPELTSRPLRPSPFFMGLIQAAMDHAKGRSGGAVAPAPAATGQGHAVKKAVAPEKQPQPV